MNVFSTWAAVLAAAISVTFTEGLARPVADDAGHRPDHVNNALSSCFPAVFNQDRGSCGSASRIGYMFTHEINAYRGADASRPENIYPTHFTWLLTNSHSGKEGMAMANGVPNSTVYGGTTYSRFFGNQDCADADFGWMQGYDKWYGAMFNRILRNGHCPAGLDTAEGREWLKNWLWNHCGDTDFVVGGIAGIGVASACHQGDIPDDSLGVNRAAGVAGMKYVKRWGDGVDHALTIVGYDDRILFDLDGNGIAGEADKDERGAWIVVNSWGAGWANGGFIYCPYKYSYPVRQQEGGAWKPEVYYVRKDYRPLRTLKVRMAYSRRSELKLLAGIASDPAATQPERTIELEHFKFAGDGSANRKKFGVETRTPMLGRWTDGVHEEPMEFGYDLTDLSAGFDTRRPLKYFFIIETLKDAIGTGGVLSASIIDYEFDTLGVETPLGEGGRLPVANHGATTTAVAVVGGEPLYAPRNLRLTAGGSLVWDCPPPTHYPLRGYVVLRDGVPVDTLTDCICRLDSAAAAYTVRAAYGDDFRLSAATAAVHSGCRTAEPAAGALRLQHSGFIIPDVLKEHQRSATVEFWMRPRSWYSWNQSIGRGWGSFLIHASDKSMLACGWDSDARLDVPVDSAIMNRWTHFAYTIAGDTLRLYVDGEEKNRLVAPGHKGVGGFGDWQFGTSRNGAMDGEMAEVRIWKTARTSDEIRSGMHSRYSAQALPADLLSYCRTGIDAAGRTVWTDVTGRALKMHDYGSWDIVADGPALQASADSSLSFGLPAAPVCAGQPFRLIGVPGTGLVAYGWYIPATGQQLENLREPELFFDRPGTYDIHMYGVTASGDTVTAARTLEVGRRRIDAAFRLSSNHVSAGERVSFLPANAVPGVRCRWDMPGTDREQATTSQAAATYEQAGDYRVRLRLSDPVTGRKRRSTLRFTVHTTAPQPQFDLSEKVVPCGRSVTLTDGSRFAPTAWTWRLTSAADTLDAAGRRAEVRPLRPGVYDVSLTAANRAGANTLVHSAALVVCNADSRNGLIFDRNEAAAATQRAPYAAPLGAMTLEWWMNASGEGAHGGFGHSAGTWQLHGDAAGRLVLTADSVRVASEKDFVRTGRWHHYAVVLDSSEVSFFRDGVKVCHRPLKNKQRTVTALPVIPTFALGGAERPMNAAIDEVRLWGRALDADELCRLANEPVANPADAARRDALLLYYDCNQNGGDVIDRTPNGNDARRTGFGPDGDAWGLSQGVFSLSPVVSR